MNSGYCTRGHCPGDIDGGYCPGDYVLESTYLKAIQISQHFHKYDCGITTISDAQTRHIAVLAK